MGLMTEYIAKKLSANGLEQELLELIRQYNSIRKTYLLVMTSAIHKQNIPDVALSQEDFYMVADMLRGLKDQNKADIYLETPGGRGEAAEEIVEFLRKKFEYVSFVISGEAKSAGTIMVLSGDEILMTQTGSLGPIDAQMRIGRSTISAYDYMEWVTEKVKEAEEKKCLNPFDATIIAQINPGELKGVNHSLRFAEDLVGKWLKEYKFKHWTVTESSKTPVTEEMRVERAKKIAAKLIDHGTWRSHGRSLKIDDLDAIGLKINAVDKDPALSDVVYRIQAVCRLLFSVSNTYKIFATADEKILKSATPVQEASPIPPSSSQKVIDVLPIVCKCGKCQKEYKLYVKLSNNSEQEAKLKATGFSRFPRDNRVTCGCGFVNDLSGVRNDIEVKTRMKVLD